MKTKITFIVLLGIMILNLSAADPVIANIDIGEVTIKILDAATGNPIPEMYVYRRISTQYAPCNAGCRKPKIVDHPADYVISDKDGIAIFPGKKILRKQPDEIISFMEFDLNLDFDIEYDASDVAAHENALGDSWRSGGGVFPRNGKNDALRLSFITYDPPSDVRYDVLKSETPRCALVRIWSKCDFTESPYKTIVIKLGNASLIENGIKTGVTLENKPKQQPDKVTPAGTHKH